MWSLIKKVEVRVFLVLSAKEGAGEGGGVYLLHHYLVLTSCCCNN